MSNDSLDPDDILITRVVNGWITKSVDVENPEHTNIIIYEDQDGELGTQKALISLIYDHFSHYLQSKHKGGIIIELKSKGRDNE